jgi:DMSO/TMAO reductase YedYZ molybdopterin-dependent catalytic subunit
MATQPHDVAPNAVFTQTPPSPRTPPPDGKDRSTRNGWPNRNTAQPRVLIDDHERIARIRTPVPDLAGHMTPTHPFYVVQYFAVPEPMRPKNWRVSIAGEAQQPLALTYEEIHRLPARSVRTVMECSGSDADFFEYFKRQRSWPVRAQEGMILSAGEFTGVRLATTLALTCPPSRPGGAERRWDARRPTTRGKRRHREAVVIDELITFLHGSSPVWSVPDWRS